MSETGDYPLERAEEFIQLFNRIERFLSQLVNPERTAPFWKLVDDASDRSAAVRAHAVALKRFAMLRNAIIHDADYPPHIVAVPSPDALSNFKRVAQEVLEPKPLIPTFATYVRCFSLNDNLPTVLEFMREHDFSQVMVRSSGGRLQMLTVEGIAWWLADNLSGDQSQANKALIGDIIPLEPPGGFMILGPDKTIFDAADAFRNAIHSEATRLYAIVITGNGDDSDTAIGFVTPWDLLHNPRAR
ncbi:MAG: CBS domain-containing protein [Terracidiphilus sp.]|jgi:hypothetical protein